MELLKRSANYLILAGVLGIVFGLTAMAYPIGTVAALVILWGIYALTDGVMALVLAFRPEAAAARWFLLIIGVIGVVAGLTAIFRPFSSALVLTSLLGVWLVLRGLMEIASAFGETVETSRWLLVLAGLFWVVAGVLFFSNPGTSAVSMTVWLGVLVIGWGMLMVLVGFRARSQAQEIA